MNISHLVEKIKKGDNKSFEKLYKLTEREVWFTCISFLKNETTAQDIMQETYITAFLKIQSLEKSSQIRSWLNRIAVNKCKNYLKGKGEIQLDDEIFENQAIVDERICNSRRVHFRQGQREKLFFTDYAGQYCPIRSVSDCV